MIPRTSQSQFVLLVASDLAMATLAWCLAFVFRFYTGLETPLGIPPVVLYIKLIPFVLGIWLLTSTATGFLRRTGRHSRLVIEILDIIPTSLISLLGLIAFTYFYEEYRYSRLTLLFFGALQPFAILFGRLMVRSGVRIYQRRQAPRNLLFIARGVGLRQALGLWRRMDLEGKTKVSVLLPGGDDTHEDRDFCRGNGLRVVEVREDWVQFFLDHPTHSILIALSHPYAQFIEYHLEKIADQVSDIRILPDVARFTRLNPGIELIDGTPLISIHESPLSGFNLVLKRGIDVVGSGILLFLLSPLLALIAFLVKRSSPGPVFYKQERMGLDGHRFLCLKFRSMPTDAESRSGAVWAQAGDNRATPFGSFLRRSSLDELPQLVNVFRGEMSLVGPRPERPVFVDKFRKEVPGYMLRHKVKTGMTGWAQVNGWRGSTSIEKRIECDLFYIQNWSLWLDVKILFMTLEEVLRGKNAY